jgi:hypothetical protein
MIATHRVQGNPHEVNSAADTEREIRNDKDGIGMPKGGTRPAPSHPVDDRFETGSCSGEATPLNRRERPAGDWSSGPETDPVVTDIHIQMGQCAWSS